MSLRDDKLNVSATMVDSQFIDDTGVQFAWDSVSLSSILACPRRYQYSIVRGLVPRSPSFAIALVFGILFHKGLEVYHARRAEFINNELRHAESEHHDAMLTAVKYLLKEPATATLPIDDDIDEMAAAHDPDEDDGITLRNSKIRTRYYLFRSLVWYLEHYKDDPAETLILPSGKPAVELSFRLPLKIDVLGTPFLLCGHIDRGVRFNNRILVSDYKTSKSLTSQWFSMFELSHQMTGYITAGSSIFEEPARGCIIDGVALQVGQIKLGRQITQRTPGQVGEYFEMLRWVRDRAIEYATTAHYPMNTTACYFCDFKAVCQQPTEYRERFISQHYFAKQGWNPLENR